MALQINQDFKTPEVKKYLLDIEKEYKKKSFIRKYHCGGCDSQFEMKLKFREIPKVPACPYCAHIEVKYLETVTM